MPKYLIRKAVAFAAIVLVIAASRGYAVDFAVYDAEQHNTNGFVFGDLSDDFFNPPLDTSGGVLSIDVRTDFDGANGLFGGMGSDLPADFGIANTQIDVALTVGPDNVASNFRIGLIDPDSPTTGDEHFFIFDLTGVPVGVPTVLTRQLSDGPDYTQTQFNQLPGDLIQNYGLSQLQIQTEFDNPDRLQIDVSQVKVFDPDLPDPPVMIDFTSTLFEERQGLGSYTYGTFTAAGALDTSGSTFIINAGPNDSGGGGVGIDGITGDFDASDHQIEVVAKLLPGNTAEQFNILLGDDDGDDSGPGLGSDDHIFAVPTSNFNETDFATFTIPLGTGTEQEIMKSFNPTNGGDELQNFDLFQVQIQAMADDMLQLNVEVESVTIVPRPAGQFDGDADFDGQDFLLWQQGFDARYDAEDLAEWQAAYGTTPATASSAAVPEPTACLLLLCATGLVSLRRSRVVS